MTHESVVTHILKNTVSEILYQARLSVRWKTQRRNPKFSELAKLTTGLGKRCLEKEKEGKCDWLVLHSGCVSRE